jgi:2-phosphoglycolate phosphatase
MILSDGCRGDLMASGRTRAVLLDLDGTLLDTAPDMADALNALRDEHALYPLPFEQIRPIVSEGAAALVRLAFPQKTESALAELRTRYMEIYRNCLAVKTQPYEGLLDALVSLAAARIPWGVVTNKPGAFTLPLLESLALRHRAAVIVSGDTLTDRKPHPAPLLYAAAKLGIAPTRCIYIGDAETDVLAARAAGMEVYVAMFGYVPVDADPAEWPATGWLETPRAMAMLIQSIAEERARHDVDVSAR